MPKPSQTRARRLILAVTLLAPLAVPATMLAGAPPAAAARARATAKKKSKGFTVKVKTGTLTLAFTPAAFTHISGGSATVGTETTVVAPAATPTAGTFTFPISGGTLNSASGHGTVKSTGGVTIESHLSIGGLFESSSSASASDPLASLGSTSMLELTSANFNPPANVPLLKLATGHVKVIGSKHSVTLNKIPASLTKEGIEFFGDSFKEGETVATVTIIAKD